MTIVFVPMFGDSFFTIIFILIGYLMTIVFVPMFGDSFFTLCFPWPICLLALCFRPHVWGSFFHVFAGGLMNHYVCSFRPHVWGSFFHWKSNSMERRAKSLVFVPMFGDPFFTLIIRVKKARELWFSSPCLGILFSLLSLSCTNCKVYMGVFVTIFGDSFFTTMLNVLKEVTINSFRPHVWGFFFHLLAKK